MSKGKSKKLQGNKNFLWMAIGLFALAIATSAGMILYVASNEDKIVTDEVVAEHEVQDRFSFEGEQGWWQGGSNDTSMVVLSESEHSACFVSAEYIEGKVDVKSELDAYKIDMENYNKDYSVKDIAQLDMTLATSEEPVEYILHQTEIITPDAGDDIKRGQEFGYIQFADGYVQIEGYCDVPDNLDKTMPVLNKLVFHKR